MYPHDLISTGLCSVYLLFFTFPLHKVSPTEHNRLSKRKARTALKSAMMGLKIVFKSKAPGDISISLAHGGFRSTGPSCSLELHDKLDTEVKRLTSSIKNYEMIIANEERKLQRYRRTAGKDFNSALTAMSAFETLQALSNDDTESTTCCICLDALGTNCELNNGSGNDQTVVSISMTKCGHLYCKSCLSSYMDQNNRHQCPSCRKELRQSDIVFIDPSKKDISVSSEARKNAKEYILRASRELEASHGCLSPFMWKQLYLSIDEPLDANRELDARISAIPSHFLAHLRECIPELPLMSFASMIPRLDLDQNCLSSKVKALIRELPDNERSVVFSSSKATIQHLEAVFKVIGINCRSLFFGQKVQDSEQAVSDWKGLTGNNKSKNHLPIPVPILLVQTGAAASGLTLTAACKMFLMEPLLHLSEEQQVYGRCHRFGQTNPVCIKVLYSPVSIDSRLLEWRRNSSSSSAAAVVMTSDTTKIVYAKLDDDDEEDDAAYDLYDNGNVAIMDPPPDDTNKWNPNQVFFGIF